MAYLTKFAFIYDIVGVGMNVECFLPVVLAVCVHFDHTRRTYRFALVLDANRWNAQRIKGEDVFAVDASPIHKCIPQVQPPVRFPMVPTIRTIIAQMNMPLMMKCGEM